MSTNKNEEGKTVDDVTKVIDEEANKLAEDVGGELDNLAENLEDE